LEKIDFRSILKIDLTRLSRLEMSNSSSSYVMLINK